MSKKAASKAKKTTAKKIANPAQTKLVKNLLSSTISKIRKAAPVPFSAKHSISAQAPHLSKLGFSEIRLEIIGSECKASAYDQNGRKIENAQLEGIRPFGDQPFVIRKTANGFVVKTEVSPVRSVLRNPEHDKLYTQKTSEYREVQTVVARSTDGTKKNVVSYHDLLNEVSSELEDEFNKDKAGVEEAFEPLSMARVRRKLENVAWQDFSSYHMVFEPDLETNFDKAALGSLKSRFKKAVSKASSSGTASTPVTESAFDQAFLEHVLRRVIIENGWSDLLKEYYADQLAALIDIFEASIAKSDAKDELFGVYSQLRPGERNEMLKSIKFVPTDYFQTLVDIYWKELGRDVRFFDWSYEDLVDDGATMIAEKWEEAIGDVVQYYSGIIEERKRNPLPEDETGTTEPESIPLANFTPYAPYSVNFGLRFVYRQEWRPLGIQRGDIVKTIPLGPRQSIKLSFKVVSRNKQTQSSEVTKETETSFESTDTTKEASEHMENSSSSFGWHAEAEASYKTGGFKGSLKAGAEGKYTDDIKDTSSRLNESVKKTANRSKLTSKMVVSTETENTFESENTTEIINPNDEVAVTYVYSRMQRQYEVMSSLNAVENVIFIAEDMPSPKEIDLTWIRKHDWILAKALLDESYRDVLSYISNSAAPPVPDAGFTNEIKLAMSAAQEAIASLSTTQTSLSQVDLVQEAQKAYREVMREKQEDRKQSDIMTMRIRRFSQHIRDNIFHYCRAVWSAEDPELRMFRLRKRCPKIPLTWHFQPAANVRVNGGEQWVEADWVPDMTTATTVDQVIENFHPIGYHGNYAIYRLKDGARIDFAKRHDVFNILSFYKQPMIDDTGSFLDPVYAGLKADKQADQSWKPLTIDVVKEMVDYIPELRSEYGHLSEEALDAKLSSFADFAAFEPLYPKYLFRKKMSLRFAVDTDNLLVDIEKGKGNVLETFKVEHRRADVVKAKLEAKNVAIENRRRSALVANNRLSDPDVEKYVAIGGPNLERIVSNDD